MLARKPGSWGTPEGIITCHQMQIRKIISLLPELTETNGYQLEGSAEAIESLPVSEMRRFAPMKRLR